MCRFSFQVRRVLTFGYSRKQTPPDKLCAAIFVAVVAVDRAAVFIADVPVAVCADDAALTVARVSVAIVAVGSVRGGASGGAASVHTGAIVAVAHVAVRRVRRLAEAARPLQALGVVARLGGLGCDGIWVAISGRSMLRNEAFFRRKK